MEGTTGAIKIDPNYARAWAIMALAMTIRAGVTGGSTDDGLAAAERALTLDASIAEAHAAKARVLANNRDFLGADSELAVALRLDPNSVETNIMAGFVCISQQKFKEAIPYFEKAAELSETNFGAFGILVGVYVALGDDEHARRYAKFTLPRARTALAKEPDNGAAMGQMALSLAVLGEADGVRELVTRALLLDPDNDLMKIRLVRALALLHDSEAALSVLDSLLTRPRSGLMSAVATLPDLEFIRHDPRFKAMLAAAEARLASEAVSPPSS